MISECFIIAINIGSLPLWVNEPVGALVKEKRIFKINEVVGYETDDSLKKILQEIVLKTKEEAKGHLSNNLKVYSQISKKIL